MTGADRLVGVGILGASMIAGDYAAYLQQQAGLSVIACASRTMGSAEALAARAGIVAVSADALLAHDAIDIILNLTPAAAHARTGAAILKAGKHLYCEKPLAGSFSEAKELVDNYAAAGLSIGSAPDTFYGSANQTARAAIDAGVVGRVVAGSATVASRGMEGWHPRPQGFYEGGGGPLLDMGPYYVAALVNLLGPVESVIGFTGRGVAQREIGSGPNAGRTFPVEADTTALGILRFHSGALITLLASWDVWRTQQPKIELHGTDASLSLPDPNFFAGDVRISRGGADWEILPPVTDVYHQPTMTSHAGLPVANYRGVGLLDLAAAIRSRRATRSSGAFALHVVEVLTAIGVASESGARVAMSTWAERPEPVEHAITP